MKIFAKLCIIGLLAFVVLQFVRPSIPVGPRTAELQVPPAVKSILEKDCYSCHSDQRRLAWFDQIVPAYWLVRYDVLTARQHLNFSTLGSKPAAAQKAALFEAFNMIQLGAMPLPRFLSLHPDSKVTPEELATLKAYLAPWAPRTSETGGPPESIASKTAAAVSPSGTGGTSAPMSLASVQPEFNGFPFEPEFENWKLLSTTDRGDNNTFRFVLGNDIAIKAAQAGNISPWPDGARFAKIAWQQEVGPDGFTHPGRFVQVEFMLKNAQLYRDTEGWGWARWRGLDLKPYGGDAHFVNECTGCHKPVRGDDYVYTLPITTAKISREEVVNNRAAALLPTLPYQPLGWNAITMYTDPNTHTTATLYGNDQALRALHPRETDPGSPKYPAGAVLALITWVQRDDPHWFGARIPDAPLSVEFVEVAEAAQMTTYRRFAGRDLAEDSVPISVAARRTNFLLTLAPAQLP
jgi:Haem-binding domain/Cytochrome P460